MLLDDSEEPMSSCCGTCGAGSQHAFQQGLHKVMGLAFWKIFSKDLETN